MAGKITELAALTGAAAATTDLVEVVDVSDTSMAATGTNKSMTLAELGASLAARTVTTYSAASNTAVIGDAGDYLRFTNAAPTYTIPANSSVAFPVGTQIDGIGTAAAMTIVAGGGVTIVKARTLVTVAAGSGWTIVKVATDTWDLHGDLV